jgi:hypothetical protein
MASDPWTPPDYPVLIAAAMKATKAQTARDLARALGYDGDEQRKVADWLRGKNSNGPTYDGTMRLLAVAGWLNTNGSSRQRRVSAAPTDPLGELAAGVKDLPDGQTETLAELRELRASVEAALETRAAPPKR